MLIIVFCIIVLCILVCLFSLPSNTDRHRAIPVPTIYNGQHNAYIHHKFPTAVQISTNYPEYLHLDKNVLHVRGFRSTHFDGKIQIEVQNNDHKTEKSILRIAPWVLKDNHCKITQLFLSSQITSSLGNSLNKYNVDIIQNNGNEPWLRDEFQVGYMDNSVYIMNGLKNNSLDIWIEKLCLRNKHLRHFHLEELSSGGRDFFGNLICLQSNHLLYGVDEKGTGCETILNFIKAQQMQKLTPIYTSWLSVGHVDEIVCMIGNKLAMISPGLAIEQMMTMDSNTPILLGDKTSTIGQVLERYKKYNLMLENQYLEDAKKKLSPDILLPVLFRPDEKGRAVAMTYNLVNIIVDPRFLITPLDNGPIIKGIPRWGKKMWTYFFPEVDILQVDTTTLHNALGGIHCGSNEIRA